MHWMARLISGKRPRRSASDPIYFRPAMTINGWQETDATTSGTFSDEIDFFSDGLAPSAIRVRGGALPTFQ